MNDNLAKITMRPSEDENLARMAREPRAILAIQAEAAVRRGERPAQKPVLKLVR